MPKMLILGTRQGVITAFKRGNNWVKASPDLNNQRVTSITASGNRLMAGTTDGLYRSFLDLNHGSDLEAALSKLKWEPLRDGIGAMHIRYLAGDPDMEDRFLVGAEPAEIYVSRNGGDTWRDCPEVAALRERHAWSLPYSPGAGCVRGFAFHGKRVYAAVEDGCVLCSDDSGDTWRLAEGSSGDPDHLPRGGFIHSDVHSIEVHPFSADRVIAPTGGGLYKSTDGGATWFNVYRCYTRAAWLDPVDQERIIFGPATSVDRGGRIEMTLDGGQSWTYAAGGLDIPWNAHMVERFTQVGEDLLAVLSNGRLIATNLGSMAWEYILPDIPFVLSAAGIEFDE